MTENIRVNPREFDRNSGDFDLTEFEIAGLDCITYNNKAMMIA